MSDAVALINSTSQGVPSPTPTGVLHFVRFSAHSAMHTVAQMTAGGAYPQDDCGPSDILSRLLDDGRSEPMRALEVLCNTTGSGTSVANLLGALQQLGYAAHYAAVAPSPAWVMNSAWGGLISPANCGPYIAASRLETIIIDTPGAWETPPPAPAGDDDMLAALTVGPDGVQRYHYRDAASGHLFEKFYDGAWHGPSDLTAAHNAPAVTGGGSATIAPGGSNASYQVLVTYWSAKGLVEMFYVTSGAAAGWHGPVGIA